MKYVLPFCFLFFSIHFFSQNKFSKNFQFRNDNDLYVSTVNDRYYTDGLFLSYSYVSQSKKETLEKKILEWKIGHEMFTPYKSIIENIEEHDRPFAAYLYASFSIYNVYKNNTLLKNTLQIGTIGPNAFGKDLQDFIHDIYGFKRAIGWKYQIKNAFAFNYTIDYTRFWAKDTSNHFDISWVSFAKLGTVYTNISTGFYARIGFKPLAKLANSLAFNTNLNNNSTNFFRKIESFIYLKPTVRYALYDATIQGSFLNTGSLVTKELIPIVFNFEAGIQFTANKFNFGYTFNYNTNKSKELRHTSGNKYGTILINYLLN